MQLIKDKLRGYGLTNSTIKTYTSILSHFFEHTKKVNSFTGEEINQYLDYLIVKKNYSARSRNLVMKILRWYCNKELNLNLHFSKSKENKPIPKICEDKDFTQLLSVTHNIKHRLCLLLMRYSGLRRWEVVRVMKHHIQPDGRLLVKSGKGDKDRYTLIPPQLLEQLTSFINLLPSDNPYIFQGQDIKHKHYSLATPEEILKNAFRKLGWQKERWFGCHALRHAFTIWAVDDVRMDFDEVSKSLGHSIKQTTQIYTQCRKLNLKRAIDLCREVSIIQ